MQELVRLGNAAAFGHSCVLTEMAHWGEDSPIRVTDLLSDYYNVTLSLKEKPQGDGGQKTIDLWCIGSRF